MTSSDTERRVRMPAGGFYSRTTRMIRLYPVLSYLSSQPAALAEMTEEEALALAASLITCVKTKRQHDREIELLGDTDLS